jgi:hypothetical protein
MEVVYNHCFGGFSLSVEGLEYYNNLRGPDYEPHGRNGRDISRTDAHLIQTVKDLGSARASGKHAKLSIATIPVAYKDCYWLHDHDGNESVECDPKALIRQRLLDYSLDSNDGVGHKAFLQSLIELAQEEYVGPF